MQIVIKPTYEELSEEAARIVADAVRAKPQLMLCIPTGRTPKGMYRELIRLYRDRRVDFSRVHFFSLDEYEGLRVDHPQSLRTFLWREFLNYVNVRRGNVYTPDENYEKTLRRVGGIDLMVLGLGSNGHIAFNEPGSPMDSRTRIVQLADSTIEAMQARFSPEELPRQAMTMGLGTILDSSRVVLLASGEAKSDALRRALMDDVSPEVPASVLRLHSNVTVIADEKAAAAYQAATLPDRQHA